MQDLRRHRAQRDEALAREIPLALIRESDRLRLRERPYLGVPELADKIRLAGQTTPVFVRPAGSGFELISGYRRCAALEHLGAETVIARVFDVDDAGAYDLAISENQDRGDLSDFERAKICLQLQSDGRTAEQIAARMGWSSERTVYRHLRIAKEAPSALRDALQQRRIQMTTADVFLDHALKLPEERQRAILAAIAEHDMSASQLKRFLDHGLKRSVPKPSPIRSLKSGGFVLGTTRFDPADPDGVHHAIQILRDTLRRARRLQRAIQRKESDQ